MYHPLLSLAGQSPAHPRNKVLILFVEVCVKRLVEQGRKYHWQRPERCPKCQSVGVWGHGYVSAYFDEAGSLSPTDTSTTPSYFIKLLCRGP